MVVLEIYLPLDLPELLFPPDLPLILPPPLLKPAGTSGISAAYFFLGRGPIFLLMVWKVLARVIGIKAPPLTKIYVQYFVAYGVQILSDT